MYLKILPRNYSTLLLCEVSSAPPAPFSLCPSPLIPVCTFCTLPQTWGGPSQQGWCGDRVWGYSERSICTANCPHRPTDNNPAPIQDPEHMVLLAPLSPIHFLFKSKFPFQAKNIRSRTTAEQQTKLQICLLLLHPNFAKLFLSMEGPPVLQDIERMRKLF